MAKCDGCVGSVVSEHVRVIEGLGSKAEIVAYLLPLRKSLLLDVVREVGLSVYSNASKIMIVNVVAEHFGFGLLIKMMALRGRS